MKKTSYWEKIRESKTFYNFVNKETGEERICAKTYLKGTVINPVTGSLVKRDDEGNILTGEFIEGYIYVNTKGESYVRPAVDPRTASRDALREVGAKIIENIDNYPTVKVRGVEEVLREANNGSAEKVEALLKVSGEVIPKLEWQHNENKLIGSPIMLEEVAKASIAMSYRSGDVTIGIDDNGRIVGIESAIARYGSIDRLECAIRNAIASRSNRLIDTDFEFRKAEGKIILVIHVKKANAPVIYNGKYFVIRCGNETRTLMNQEILDYIAEFSA